MSDDWTVRIVTSDDPIRPGFQPDADRGSRVVEASVEALRQNWHDTVRKLVAIGDGMDDEGSAWGVAQIEVGLTLNAKGQLLFIAEAGAEASVKITLKRREP